MYTRRDLTHHMLWFIVALVMLAPACRSDTPEDEPQNMPVLQDYGDELGGDFTLTDHNGQRFDLSQHRGEAHLTFFGYTYCPDVCPSTLSKLSLVYEHLNAGPDERIRTLFVSVDPERDTPVQLKDYLQYFSTVDVLGLTGPVEDIDRVVAQYGTMYEKADTDSKAGYLINHSTLLYLIDRQGKVCYLFRQDDSPEYIASGIKQVF